MREKKKREREWKREKRGNCRASSVYTTGGSVSKILRAASRLQTGAMGRSKPAPNGARGGASGPEGP